MVKKDENVKIGKVEGFVKVLSKIKNRKEITQALAGTAEPTARSRKNTTLDLTYDTFFNQEFWVDYKVCSILF